MTRLKIPFVCFIFEKIHVFLFVSSKKLCTFAFAFASISSGFSAVGSAHVWGARGRWFESSNPDQKKIQTADYQQFGFLLCSKLACFWRASYCFGVP